MTLTISWSMVATRKAWPFYLEAGGYFFQPGRTLHEAMWTGFHANRTDYPAVAKVRRVYEEVQLTDSSLARYTLSPDPLDRALAKMIQVSRDHLWGFGPEKAFVPSGRDAPETVHPNGGSGLHHAGSTAWTMSRRNRALGVFMDAQSTADLVTHDQ